MFALMHPLTIFEQQFVDELAHLYPASEARELCFLLLEHRLGWSRTDRLLRKSTTLSDLDAHWLADALRQLTQAIPIQHLLGHAWFMGMKLAVNQSVLIPRPETEELVQLIIDEQQALHTGPNHIIDIGTGSGCIAIALKKAFPDATVHALDVSTDALRVAKGNAASQAAGLQFIHADIRDWNLVFQPGQAFDTVVSNPPYITEREKAAMHRNVLAHEPHLALFVDDDTPLLFYAHIAAFAAQHLNPDGTLYFEINRRYGPGVHELLHKMGFEHVQLHQDMHGADRMVRASKPAHRQG